MGTNQRFFRVVKGFAAQFGLNGDPEITAEWKDKKLPDDPVKQSNTKGRISFATAAANSRTTQLFINLGDNTYLDEKGFAPFAQVVDGMDVIEQLYAGYGEGPPNGNGPSQGQLAVKGQAYLDDQFP